MRSLKRPAKSVLAQLALGVDDIINEFGWQGFSKPEDVGRDLVQEPLPGLEGVGQGAVLEAYQPDPQEDEDPDEIYGGLPEFEREDIEIGIDLLISRMINRKLINKDKVGRQPTLSQVFSILYDKSHPILELVDSFEQHIKGYFGVIEYGEMEAAFQGILKIEQLIKEDLRKANAYKSSSLLQAISQRIADAGADPVMYFRDAAEIVVFGSVAAGLDRPDSDIDVLCIGSSEGRLKTDRLDFLAISKAKSEGRQWQQSELAGHICTYGIWLQGKSQAARFVHFSQECIEAKRRRVAAFMRLLPESWGELDPDFRIKYSLKVRRETQRLIRIESHVAVPPTRVLDRVPPNAAERFAVCDRLQRLAEYPHRSFCNTFFEAMLREWDRLYLTD